MALKSDRQEERIASLEYLRMLPGESVFTAMYQAMDDKDLELREAVYQTLVEIAAYGIAIPDPNHLKLINNETT